MPFSTPIVPMPQWSTPVGCTKLFLTIVVLAFVTACAVIRGLFPAFSISLFTAALSLVTFSYYMLALSFKPFVYNKWLILSLETTLTLCWFVSLILLAGWTGASIGFPQCYHDIRSYPTIDGTSIGMSGGGIQQRTAASPSLSSLVLCKRREVDTTRTRVRYHGTDAHYAAQILAGIAAGLAGMIFILYGTTAATFTMNFHMSTSETEVSAPHTALDEEAQTVSPTTGQAQDHPHHGSHPSPLRSNVTHTPSSPTATNTASPRAMTPSSITEPLRFGTLPKDFEHGPQKQTYYAGVEEASNPSIEPPTPVSEAMVAEKVFRGSASNDFVIPVAMDLKKMGESTTVKDDGRVEREI